jgi:hypothetical protein
MRKCLNIYWKSKISDMCKKWLLILFVVMIHVFCLVVISKSFNRSYSTEKYISKNIEFVALKCL